MHVQSEIFQGMPWPSVGFGGIRLWATYTNWSDLNPSRGVYDWTRLDAWLRLAQTQGVDVLYTFGGTPAWASSNPAGICDYGNGSCYPPANLRDWDDFVRAIVGHSAGRIKYWELWNEANLHQYWSGTVPDLVAMARRAHILITSIDPSAVVLTPSATGGSNPVAAWLDQYFAAGGGDSAEVVAFHGYPSSVPAVPESITQIIDSVMNTMNRYGQSSKPVWDTEDSWGTAGHLPNLDDQAAYVARNYILHWSRGVPRFYWYAWNDTLWGTLWDMSANTILKPGVAYGEIYKWLVGATMEMPCSTADDSTWICLLTRPGGYEAEIVWNASVAAPNTASFTAPGQFAQYRDLDGKVFPIPGATVQIGSKPILLEQFTGLSLSQTKLRFDHLSVGTTSSPQAVTLTNVGTVPLLLSSVETSGDYSQTNSCGGSVTAGTSCTVNVIFSPTAPGPRTGAVFVNDNAPGSPQIVSLSNAEVAPIVILSPTTLSFSTELVGSRSATNTVRLSNTGSGALLLNGVTIGGANGDDFAISESTCGTVVSEATSCTIGVAFVPSAVGRDSATLMVTTNMQGNSPTALLDGSGMDFSVNAASAGVLSAVVVAGQTAQYNLRVAPLGGFTGAVSVSVNCKNVPLGGLCEAAPGSIALSGASPAPIVVSVGTTFRAPQLSTTFVIQVLFMFLLAADAMYRKHCRRVRLASIGMSLLLLVLAGCATTALRSGGGSAAQRTPSGVYTVVVTASSQGVSRTLDLTLEVE